jgi:CRISPR-associated endonuclease Cas1
MTNVVVVDGYGIRLAVQRGHLVIDDGIGSQRRSRRYPRIERNLRRILILGQTGSISLDALRWCSERHIAITQLDADSRIISLTTAPGLNDPRLRRAQAIADHGQNGLAIARLLITAKVSAQAIVANDCLNNVVLAASIRSHVETVARARSIADAVDAESHAANAYFGGWAGYVQIRFTEHDHAAVPDHWHAFASRRSPIMRGRTPRVAATPINALLNYLYSLAEVECRIALVTLGLDAGLGIVHTDKKARDSLALDLLEVARPAVDRYLLQLLSRRHFRAGEFIEGRDGSCRLAPTLAASLASTSLTWMTTVAPYAEQVAHELSRSTSRRETTTPLTRVNSHPCAETPRSSGRRSRSEPDLVEPLASTCRVCGADLPEKGRKVCSACWPPTRAQLARDRARRGQAALSQERAAGSNPSEAPEAKAARGLALSRRKREQLEWEASRSGDDVELDLNVIVGGLRDVPLSRIQSATGLSLSACSRIRSRLLAPHKRHWPALAALAESSKELDARREG